MWLSLVERYVRDVEVAGSNPVASIPWQGRTENLEKDFQFFYVPKHVSKTGMERKINKASFKIDITAQRNQKKCRKIFKKKSLLRVEKIRT